MIPENLKTSKKKCLQNGSLLLYVYFYTSITDATNTNAKVERFVDLWPINMFIGKKIATKIKH